MNIGNAVGVGNSPLFPGGLTGAAAQQAGNVKPTVLRQRTSDRIIVTACRNGWLIQRASDMGLLASVEDAIVATSLAGVMRAIKQLSVITKMEG